MVSLGLGRHGGSPPLQSTYGSFTLTRFRRNVDREWTKFLISPPQESNHAQSRPPLSQFKAPQAQLSDEPTSFCSEHGLLSYIPVAIELIERCFPSLQELHLLHEQDPETEEEWLVLDITTRGDEKQVLEAYDRYTDGCSLASTTKSSPLLQYCLNLFSFPCSAWGRLPRLHNNTLLKRSSDLGVEARDQSPCELQSTAGHGSMFVQTCCTTANTLTA